MNSGFPSTAEDLGFAGELLLLSAACLAWTGLLGLVNTPPAASQRIKDLKDSKESLSSGARTLSFIKWLKETLH